MLTCQLLWAMGVVSGIQTYDWRSITYGFFISFLWWASQRDFRSLEGCWQISTWCTYECIPALRPHYTGLSTTTYPRAYGWAQCRIMRVVIVQLVIIFAALDCVTRYEIIVRPYDGTLLGRPELTIVMGQLRIRRWF